MAASAAPRFNLGILQALAENQLLHKFDYLSTLSGGGYIGSWLAASTYRLLTTLPNSSFRDVEKALVPGKREPGGREERTFLRWLRLYSNYLTPHTGVLPGDTWAMIGTWLRNVFLNQTVLGLLFLGVFVCCHGVLLGLMRSSRLGATGLLFAGVLAWFIAAVSMAVNVPDQILSKEMLLTAFQRVKVTVMVILPFFLACLLLNSGLWRWRDVKANLPLWMWLAGCGAFYFVAWGGGGGTDEAVERDAGEENPGRTDAFPTAFSFSAFAAGAVGGALGCSYTRLLNRMLPGPVSHSAHWIVGVFGTGVLMLILLLAGALHLGFANGGPALADT